MSKSFASLALAPLSMSASSSADASSADPRRCLRAAALPPRLPSRQFVGLLPGIDLVLAAPIHSRSDLLLGEPSTSHSSSVLRQPQFPMASMAGICSPQNTHPAPHYDGYAGEYRRLFMLQTRHTAPAFRALNVRYNGSRKRRISERSSCRYRRSHRRPRLADSTRLAWTSR